MCGIFGITAKGAILDKEDPFLTQTAEGLRHRGPDENGFFTGDRVGLGMTRLSIMDVSNGQQPFFSKDRKIVAVFNGEIYNYRELRDRLKAKGYPFQTETDGELLPFLYQEYGLDFVHHLNGIYAIAVWDDRTDQLLLVRDRLGVKPLFYTQTPRRFMFASEIRPLLRAPGVARAVERKNIAEYLLFRYVAGSETLFKGIYSLLPGHFLALRGPRMEIKRYWTPEVSAGPEMRNAEVLEAFKHLMNDSVERQMVSDVPLGALLSGGLDSSYLCALAVKHYKGGTLNTFSVGYDGREGYNELPQARMVGQFLKTRRHELLLNNQQFADHMEDVSASLEMPIYQPNAIPLYLICRMAKPFVSVLLSGEGADELFGGYPRYRTVPLNLARRLPGVLQKMGRYALTRVNHRRTVKLAEALTLTPEDMILQNAAFIRSAVSDQLLNENTPWDFPVRRAYQAEEPIGSKGSMLNQLLVYEQKTYLVSLLERLDRMSMASSIEVRVPFLDHRVVELSNRISANWKLQPWNSKILLNEAEGLIPPSILQRKKWGFVAPLVDWMRHPTGIGAYLDLLEEPAFRQEEFFDPLTVRTLVREHRAGNHDHSEVLWELLTFALWHKIFFRSSQREEVAAL